MPLERRLYNDLLKAISQMENGEAQSVIMKEATLGEASEIITYLSKRNINYQASLTDYGLKISKKEGEQKK